MTDIPSQVVRLPTGRVVGYRRIGNGPPVVLLHASPRSSAALVPLARRLADRHTVFAFDTPGFGWSDALPIDRPDAADFGDALIEAFDALGIGHAGVYGSHTGAAIAVAAGQRHPGRVSALALDGYALFTATEQAEYLATYLAKLAPSWDGSHLAFLWSRVKDQFTVFPWYMIAQVARLPRPRPSPEFMQGVVVDFLAAGDSYRAGYAAAFRYDGLAELRRLTIPAVVLARSDDLLFADLDRVLEVPDCIAVQHLGEDHGEWAEAIQAAMARGGAGQLGAAPEPAEGGLRVTPVPSGAFGITHHPGPATRPIVLLPAIPGSARGEAAMARALSRSRPVHVVDLPGFGASTWNGPMQPDAIAGGIRAALAIHGITEFDVVGLGESDSIAAALAGTARLVLVDPVPPPARATMIAEMADVTPRRDGAHLLTAWHQLRDTTLFRPWFDDTPAHAIDCGTDPDTPRLHAIMTDWMRGGQQGAATLAAAMNAPYPTRPAVVLARAGHPWTADLPTASNWPDQRDARAAAILRGLESPV
jgi:pimeloyl-ACP methyl ester carboxylesterase